MAYPVIVIFTKTGCGACEHFMKNYQNFARDVKGINSSCKIRVHTVGDDWATRVTNYNYGIADLDNKSQTPPIKGLRFAPMISVVRSDQIGDLSKLRVNGASLNAKTGYFEPNENRVNDLRAWLAQTIQEIMPGNSSGVKKPNANREDVARILEEISTREDPRVKKEAISQILSNIKEVAPRKKGEDVKIVFKLVSLDK